MKKFKSKYLIVIIVLLLVLSVILYFSLSKKEEPTLSPQPEQTLTTSKVETLSSPRNLTIVNNLLTWQEVEAADGYIVTVDGYEYLTETNVFNLSVCFAGRTAGQSVILPFCTPSSASCSDRDPELSRLSHRRTRDPSTWSAACRGICSISAGRRFRRTGRRSQTHVLP